MNDTEIDKDTEAEREREEARRIYEEMIEKLWTLFQKPENECTKKLSR
jgi:hypothetical protein